MADQTILVRLDGDGPAIREVQKETEPLGLALLQDLTGAGGGAPAAKPRALQLVSVFLRDVPLRLLELHGAVERDERHLVHDIAETLHGMCQGLGAQPMAQSCHLLADMTEIEGAGGAGRLLGRIEKEFARVRTVLDPMLRPPQPPPAAGPAAPPIDPITLQQLRAQGGTGLGSQLVSLFLIEVPGRVAALERAVGASEQRRVEALAHDLRGICALLGAQPMAGLCDELARCAGEEPRSAAARLSRLREEFARVTSVLEGLVGSTPVGTMVSQ